MFKVEKRREKGKEWRGRKEDKNLCPQKTSIEQKFKLRFT